jgi:hypothetical protein
VRKAQRHVTGGAQRREKGRTPRAEERGRSELAREAQRRVTGGAQRREGGRRPPAEEREGSEVATDCRKHDPQPAHMHARSETKVAEEKHKK